MGRKNKRKTFPITYNYHRNGKLMHGVGKSIEEFVNYKFISDNPLAPVYYDEIENIKFYGHRIELPSVIRLMDLVDYVKKNVGAVESYNIPRVKVKKIKDANFFREINDKIYESKETYSFDYIMDAFADKMYELKNDDVCLDGDMIHANSERYRTFRESGNKCINCGIVGTHFKKQKFKNQNRYHLNLYGTDEKGCDVMICTKHSDIPNGRVTICQMCLDKIKKEKQ